MNRRTGGGLSCNDGDYSKVIFYTSKLIIIIYLVGMGVGFNPAFSLLSTG